jgi:hypothetical protein
LNHFTVPVAIEKHLPHLLTNGQGRRNARTGLALDLT